MKFLSIFLGSSLIILLSNKHDREGKIEGMLESERGKSDE